MPFLLDAFVVTTVLLAVNLMGLWVYSGLVRARSGVAVNPEDVRANVKTDPVEPEAVQRVLRAHANAQAAIVPFLFLALAYTLRGGNSTTGIILFTIFVVARYAHSFAYLNALQPARSIAFAGGFFTTAILAIAVLAELVL